jgi:hypothetical protein
MHDPDLDSVDVERLEEIKDEMLELLQRARAILRGTTEQRRAESYWLAHIEMALHNDHGYLGNGGITMTDTIDALRAEADQVVTEQLSLHHGDANGRLCDQVYQGPDGFWRVIHRGKPLHDEWTTREAAQDHLNALRRSA